LPKIIDKDGDPVQLSVKMGAASLFVEFNPKENTFTIENTQVESKSVFKEGYYTWQLNLSDNKDVVTSLMTLKVTKPFKPLVTNSTIVKQDSEL
jgi:hypothetical protein